jgi:imidazolonepropionase
VRTTSLAAHALPPEFEGRPDDYIDAVCSWLPASRPPAWWMRSTPSATPSASRRRRPSAGLRAAQALGLPVKLHAEQLSDQGGAALAARFGALSCDHLEHLSAEGIAAMAEAGTVAVLLPGAYYFLRDTKLPPVAALREAGVPMAWPPTTTRARRPCLSLLLMLNMACTLFRLTPEEAWRGVTVHAARALGLPTAAGWPPGSAPTSRCGTPSTRASWPTASATTPAAAPAGPGPMAAWRP